MPADAPFQILGGERGWILLLVLTVWAYDTGAYLVGRNFGRTKFLTHISPSKTIEGLIGGIVAATDRRRHHAGGVLGQNRRSTRWPWVRSLALARPGRATSPNPVIKRAAGGEATRGRSSPATAASLDRVDSFLLRRPRS